MTNPVQAAMEAAQNKADEAQDAPVEQPQATAVATVSQNAAPMTLDDLTQGSMAVDDWLKVNEFGLLVATHSGKLFPSAEFIIDTSLIQPCEVIKFGNPATYMKTYDRVTCTTGGTWQEAQMKAKQVDHKANPYPSAEIPFEVIEDIKVGDEVVAKAGVTLGHSTSTTNYKNLSGFMKELKANGKLGAKVKTKVGFEKREKGSNTWGLLTFEILEILD